MPREIRRASGHRSGLALPGQMSPGSFPEAEKQRRRWVLWASGLVPARGTRPGTCGSPVAGRLPGERPLARAWLTLAASGGLTVCPLGGADNDKAASSPAPRFFSRSET